MEINIFFTAGYNTYLSTLEMIQALEKAGVDRVEVGMPYSDPVVDGPVIQNANQVALANGMTIDKLLNDLKGLKNKVQIPVVLMGYLNPVLQYGIEKFCTQCEEIGISGLILPDLPPHIYEVEYYDLFQKHGLKMTFIITPQTSKDRIAYLDNLSEGFIYAVSDSSITGSAINHDKRTSYFEMLKDFPFKNKCFVGFGIRKKEDLDYLSQYVDGGVIGTAFIENLNQNKNNVSQAISEFIQSLKD